MRAHLARTGLAVFAMLFAITLCTEHIADGRALVAGANVAVDLPQLRAIAVALSGDFTPSRTVMSTRHAST